MKLASIILFAFVSICVVLFLNASSSHWLDSTISVLSNSYYSSISMINNSRSKKGVCILFYDSAGNNDKYNKVAASCFLEEYLKVSTSEKKSPQKMIDLLTRAIDKDDKLAEAFYYRAELYKKIGEFNKAESDYIRTIDLNYEKVHGYSSLADIYFRKGQHRKFIDYKYKSLTISDRLNIQYKLTENISVRDYDRLVIEFPSDYKVYLLRGHRKFLDQTGKRTLRDFELSPPIIDKALLTDINQSIKLYRKQPFAYLLLAFIYQDVLTYKVSEEKYNKFVKLILENCYLGLLYDAPSNIENEIRALIEIYGH